MIRLSLWEWNPGLCPQFLNASPRLAQTVHYPLQADYRDTPDSRLYQNSALCPEFAIILRGGEDKELDKLAYAQQVGYIKKASVQENTGLPVNVNRKATHRDGGKATQVFLH